MIGIQLKWHRLELSVVEVLDEVVYVNKVIRDFQLLICGLLGH
jgi:hypothetical protein